MELVVVRKVIFSEEDLLSILVGAWEGGSDYWIDYANIHHPAREGMNDSEVVSEFAFDALKSGGTIEFYEDDEQYDNKNPVPELTLAKFIDGLRMFLELYEKNPNAMAFGGCCPYMDGNTIDAGNIDSMGSDCILQYALFGEIIYG